MKDNSGVNTILLVVIVVIIVGALVWIFRGETSPSVDEVPQQEDTDLNVNVDLPYTEEDGATNGPE